MRRNKCNKGEQAISSKCPVQLRVSWRRKRRAWGPMRGRSKDRRRLGAMLTSRDFGVCRWGLWKGRRKMTVWSELRLQQTSRLDGTQSRTKSASICSRKMQYVADSSHSSSGGLAPAAGPENALAKFLQCIPRSQFASEDAVDKAVEGSKGSQMQEPLPPWGVHHATVTACRSTWTVELAVPTPQVGRSRYLRGDPLQSCL